MRGELEPKPFAYIPIPHTRPAKSRAPGHDRLNPTARTGRLELRVEVVSEYLFVGSGGYDFEGDTVFYSFARSHGEPVIPGTSIKGAVRSLVEAISNSCVSLIVSRSRAGTRGNEERVVPMTHRRCEKADLLCPACRIFGTAGAESYAGRVSFSDSKAQTLARPELVKIGDLWPPHVKDSARRFYAERRFIPPADMQPERDYRFVEAVRKGTVFGTNLTFTNLAQEELSLILHALGIPQPHIVKIGGAKPRGFGSVWFTATQLVMWLDPFVEPERKEGDEVEQVIRDVCREATLVQTDLLRAYQQRMAAEADRPAPRRMY